MTTITPRTLLQNAYGLLGDGNGQEWNLNTEYTRAIVQLVADTLGLSAADDHDEVLRRIREAGVTRLQRSDDTEFTWEGAHDDLNWIAEQNIAHLDVDVIANLQRETTFVLRSLHNLRQTIADA